MNTTCNQSCILQFKEYIQGRLYKIRVNYIKPYIDLSNTQYVLRFLCIDVWYVNLFLEVSQIYQIK
jgi:hypothetical protein